MSHDLYAPWNLPPHTPPPLFLTYTHTLTWLSTKKESTPVTRYRKLFLVRGKEFNAVLSPGQQNRQTQATGKEFNRAPVVWHSSRNCTALATEPSQRSGKNDLGNSTTDALGMQTARSIQKLVWPSEYSGTYGLWNELKQSPGAPLP